MTTRKLSALAATLVAATIMIFSSFAFAHGNEQHVMGTVTKIDGTTITVKTTDGAIKTVMVIDGTKFVKNGAATSQSDLKVGDRVVIHAKPVGEMLHATEVKIGQRANTKAAKQ